MMWTRKAVVCLLVILVSVLVFAMPVQAGSWQIVSRQARWVDVTGIKPAWTGWTGLQPWRGGEALFHMSVSFAPAAYNTSDTYMFYANHYAPNFWHGVYVYNPSWGRGVEYYQTNVDSHSFAWGFYNNDSDGRLAGMCYASLWYYRE